MSQHIYPATIRNHAVWVQLGWDRPLQTHYLVIEYVDPPTSDADSASDGFVYSNLDDPKLARDPQLAGDLGYFAQVLVAHGLTPFENVMNEVRKDRAHNVGNRVVKYDAHGTALQPTRTTPAT